MPTSFAPSHLPASLLPVARFDDVIVRLNVRGQRRSVDRFQLTMLMMDTGMALPLSNRGEITACQYTFVDRLKRPREARKHLIPAHDRR